MSTADDHPQRDFQFFVDIIDAFKASGESASEGDYSRMQVVPFLEAMTMFLRIFDAFSNPFFSEVVKKDVIGNINVRILRFPTHHCASWPESEMWNFA